MRTTPEGTHWTLEPRGDVAILRYGLPTPVQAPIAAMADLVERLRSLAARGRPPVVVLAVGILHAHLGEVLEQTRGRHIRDFMPWNDATVAIEEYPLPVLGAIPVRASAGGTELVLACDVLVAAPEAKLGLLETRLGIIPGGGGTQRLSRRVSPGQAAHIVYGAGAVSGQEAWRIGFVDQLADDPVEHAAGLAADYALRGPTVLAAAKTALRAAADLPLAEGLRVEGRAFLKLLPEPQAAERVQAWIDAPGEF